MNEQEGHVAELYCPHCKKKQVIQANMYHTEYVKADVLVYKDRCEIDWETADIAGDFEYICDMCGARLAADIEDLHNKLKKEEENEQRKC